VTPLCQIGCVETDPNPSAAGVFLGSGVTPTACTYGTDSDQDGLTDFCEKNLAAAFAPELAYATADNVGREPHWVARRLFDDEVRLGYLLSYHVDLGIDAWETCLNFLPSEWCHGHAGDSEDMYLDVVYDYGSEHWLLSDAYYSRHGEYAHYGPGLMAIPQPWPTLRTLVRTRERTSHITNMPTTHLSQNVTLGNTASRTASPSSTRALSPEPV
jgi:hypothetical protein